MNIMVLEWAFFKGGKELMLQILRENPIKHYEERYDPNIYDIDFANPRISRLNQIADTINERVKMGCLDSEEFLSLSGEVSILTKDAPL